MSKLALLMVWVFSFHSTAYGLDPSAAVQASTILQTTSSWDGQPLEYPAGKPEITGMLVEVAPGGETGWHLHPFPSFGVLLEGELEVQLKDGAVKRLKPGEALAEVVNVFHNGRNVGAVPVKIVVFYAGIAGQKLSVKEKRP